MTKSLSHTARSVLYRCPRLFFFKYIEGLEKKRTGSGLRMGTAFSNALEHWDPTKVNEYYEELLRTSTDVDLFKSATNELVISRCFAERYMQSAKQHRRELEFGPWIVNGFRWNGFIDGELEPGTIIENKLKSRWTAADERGLKIDDQVTGYIAAYSMMTGLDPEQIELYYHVCIKPGIRLRKGETEQAFTLRLRATIEADWGKYFKSYRLTRTSDQVAEFIEDLAHAAQYMKWLEKSGRYPMNRTACTLYGECEMMPMCLAGSDEELMQALDLYTRRERGPKSDQEVH